MSLRVGAAFVAHVVASYAVMLAVLAFVVARGAPAGLPPDVDRSTTTAEPRRRAPVPPYMRRSSARHWKAHESAPPGWRPAARLSPRRPAVAPPTGCRPAAP